MKLFKNIKKWLEDQEHLFYLFLFILIVPNIVLCFTEPLSFIAKTDDWGAPAKISTAWRNFTPFTLIK